MTDLLIRSAERSEDLVAKLAARLRAGEVALERVSYAAALGYGPALELTEPAWLPSGRREQSERGAFLLGQREAVLWAADVAEDALMRYWTVDDRSPWEAANAARAWAEDPSEERLASARRAAASAREARAARVGAGAGASASSAAASAAEVATAAGWSTAETAAVWAASAARTASRAAASAREESWFLYLGWLAERLCWSAHD